MPIPRARAPRVAGFAGLLAAIAAGTGVAAAGAGDCPWARLEHGDVPIAQGLAAARETTVTDTLHLEDPKKGAVFTGSGEVSYDLLDRHFSASVVCDLSLYSSGAAAEEYEILGLPPGTPVTLRVRLRVVSRQSYDVYCGGSGCTPQSHGAVYGEANELPLEVYVGEGWPGHTQPVERTIERTIEFERTAGLPFRLRYEWWAGTSHTPSSAAVDVTIGFEGLPAGAHVVGCLDPDVPVPASASTWGALKRRYR